jgi:hypothetical protein
LCADSIKNKRDERERTERQRERQTDREREKHKERERVCVCVCAGWSRSLKKMKKNGVQCSLDLVAFSLSRDMEQFVYHSPEMRSLRG